MGMAPPWVVPALGESVVDELRAETLSCFVQSAGAREAAALDGGSGAAGAATAAGAAAGAVAAAHDSADPLRLVPAKLLFLFNPYFDDPPLGGAAAAPAAAPSTMASAAAVAAHSAAPSLTSPSLSAALVPTRPRALAQSLPAVGGPAALLMVVRRASDTRALVLALRLVGHFLALHPLNTRQLIDESADFGLRFLLRAKPQVGDCS